MSRIPALPVVLVALGLAGCPKPEGDTLERTDLTGAEADRHGELVAEGDARFAERGEQSKLEAAIEAWEQAVALKPDDWRTREKLARAYVFLGDGHLQLGGDVPGAVDAFAKSYEHAELGMRAANPEVEKRLQAGVSVKEVAELLGRPEIGLVYWYASGLGAWGNLKGRMVIMKHKDTIDTMQRHVLATGPDTFHYGADRYFGAFYAAAPAMIGGDLDKSREHFDAAIAGAPNYLGNYILEAEYYAVKSGDEALFDAALTKVEEAAPCPADPASSEAPCILAELAPEAAVEKEKAARLRAKRDELF